MQYSKVVAPSQGSRIEYQGGQPVTPDQPIIPFVRGDGTGPDIWAATQPVLDAAVRGSYGGRRAIQWMEVYAGDKAQELYGEYLPRETLDVLRHFAVAIKGPLTTPVGGGIRSLNVALRQEFDLYACIRPVRYFEGVPSPVKEPQNVDIVIFRENTEDVYAGLEWRAGSPEAEKLRVFLHDELGKTVRPDAGLGIKPISKMGSQRLVRRAIQYALDHGRDSVTIVHKGNIMKFTEGAFRDWGYELAREEFGDRTISEDEVYSQHGGAAPRDRVVIKDRIADSMFQQLLLRPAEYGVLAMPNLNGDYLSDAAAAQVGGLGMAPGANLGDHAAIFEATHGTAPKYAGKDVINPSSLILSGAMLLEHLGWGEAAQRVYTGMQAAIRDKIVTYDLERQMTGATKVGTSRFGQAIIERM